MAAHFLVLVFYNTLTCDKAVILLFCLGHEGEKDADTFTLRVVRS